MSLKVILHLCFLSTHTCQLLGIIDVKISLDKCFSFTSNFSCAVSIPADILFLLTHMSHNVQLSGVLVYAGEFDFPLTVLQFLVAQPHLSTKTKTNTILPFPHHTLPTTKLLHHQLMHLFSGFQFADSVFSVWHLDILLSSKDVSKINRNSNEILTVFYQEFPHIYADRILKLFFSTMALYFLTLHSC